MGNGYVKSEYSAKTTWGKFAKILIGGLAAGAGADVILDGLFKASRSVWPDWIVWDESSDAAVAAWIAGALGGATMRLLQNWSKESDGFLANVAQIVLNNVKLATVLLCAALLLQSCATTGRGLGKPTLGEQEFIEETAAVYDEHGNLLAAPTKTIWRNTFEVPPGGDSAQVAGMEYQGEGWRLKISGDSAIDSTSQAQTILQIAEMQTNALITGMQIGGGFLSRAIPLGEMALQGSNERRMYRLQNPGPSTLEQLDESPTAQGLFERWDARLTRLENEWLQMRERLLLQNPMTGEDAGPTP